VDLEAPLDVVGHLYQGEGVAVEVVEGVGIREGKFGF